MADHSLPDVLEPPPRITGNVQADIGALSFYLTQLYGNFILSGGVLLAAAQPAPSLNTNGGIEAFPVGALFISTVATDPSALLGYGTWVRFGNGKVLIGVDETDSDFDEAAKTSGAKLVTPAGSVAAPVFTGSALGTHSHGAGTLATDAHNVTTHGATTGADFNAVTAIANHTISGTTAAVSAGTPAGTNSAPAFTGTPQSTLQPGISVYLWQRTA